MIGKIIPNRHKIFLFIIMKKFVLIIVIFLFLLPLNSCTVVADLNHFNFHKRKYTGAFKNKRNARFHYEYYYRTPNINTQKETHKGAPGKKGHPYPKPKKKKEIYNIGFEDAGENSGKKLDKRR